MLIGNVAYNKSSIHGDQQFKGKDLAVDGNLNGSDCAYYDSFDIRRAGWQVDLGTVHMIYNTTLYISDLYSGTFRFMAQSRVLIRQHFFSKY